MTHPDSDLIAVYAEGQPLTAERRNEMEAHLGECPRCRGEVEWIRSLREEAVRSFPEEVEPPATLWAAIEEGIRSSARPPRQRDWVLQRDGVLPMRPRRDSRRGPSPRRPVRRRWNGLALRVAAALFLVGLSSVVTYTVVRSGAGVDPGAGATSSVAEGPAGTMGDDVRFTATAEELEEAYGPAIQELQAALAEDRDRLAPETVRVLEENLQIIDQALGEALAALAADPGSRGAAGLVGGMYETKVELLRQAVRLVREA